MKKIRPLMFWAIALMTLALVVAGCGSSATPSPTPQPTVAGDGPKATVAAVPSSPTPSPTVVASPTAQPPPAISAEETPASVAQRLADEAMAFLTLFTRDVSPRASGSEQERAAADFLVSQFEAMGYQTGLQPFNVDLLSSEVLVGTEAREFQNFPMQLSGRGRASGTLVNVFKALERDILPEGLDGKIALIQRGEIPFEEKVGRVADAGALAAVVYNDRFGGFRGLLASQARIPVVSISLESGGHILDLMGEGTVEATVSVTFEILDTQNVIAEKPGTASDERVVVLGGHYDTVPDVPGANDNGSGIATLMTIAREVSEKTYPFTLRLIGFGTEELGLRGSRFYVDSLSPQEQDSIIAMLNFDALGTGDVVGVLGEFGLVNRAVEYGDANGIASERRFSLAAGTSSDHASFQQAGIPAVFFLADDFSRIHTPDDKLDFVQPELMGNSAALAIALLDSLAER